MKIVTAVVNNPQFIEIQYHTLKKYFKGDYEFIVFNDAKTFPDFTNGDDITIKTQIEEMCATLQIQCIPIPNDHHRGTINASDRCADSMNVILKYQKENPDKFNNLITPNIHSTDPKSRFIIRFIIRFITRFITINRCRFNCNNRIGI